MRNRTMEAIMVRIGIIAVLAGAAAAHGGNVPLPGTCRPGIPAFSQANRPAFCRPAPCTSLPESRSRITGFDSVCRPVTPCNTDPCNTRCNTGCNDWLPIGPGVWINGYWYDDPVIVPVGTDNVTVQADVDVNVDIALVDLHQRRYSAAAGEFLRRHETRVLEESKAEGGAVPDRSWLRLHALALSGAGDFIGAARAFETAYAEDPVLAGDPVDGGELFASRAELRRVVVDAVRSAHRSGNTQIWITVGHLMEAEGRFDRAVQMFARAPATLTP